MFLSLNVSGHQIVKDFHERLTRITELIDTDITRMFNIRHPVVLAGMNVRWQ